MLDLNGLKQLNDSARPPGRRRADPCRRRLPPGDDACDRRRLPHRAATSSSSSFRTSGRGGLWSSHGAYRRKRGGIPPGLQSLAGSPSRSHSRPPTRCFVARTSRCTTQSGRAVRSSSTPTGWRRSRPRGPTDGATRREHRLLATALARAVDAKDVGNAQPLRDRLRALRPDRAVARARRRPDRAAPACRPAARRRQDRRLRRDPPEARAARAPTRSLR